jgi:hypothetical protein
MAAFSSDMDLTKIGRSGSSGSDIDGQQQRKPVALSSQLYNSLVSTLCRLQDDRGATFEVIGI